MLGIDLSFSPHTMWVLLIAGFVVMMAACITSLLPGHFLVDWLYSVLGFLTLFGQFIVVLAFFFEGGAKYPGNAEYTADHAGSIALVIGVTLTVFVIVGVILLPKLALSMESTRNDRRGREAVRMRKEKEAAEAAAHLRSNEHRTQLTRPIQRETPPPELPRPTQRVPLSELSDSDQPPLRQHRRMSLDDM